MAAREENGKRHAVLIRIPAELHIGLKELAKRERRTMAAQARIAIEEHLGREREAAGKA